MKRFVTTMVAFALLCVPASAAIQGPLRVHPTNPRYFTDDSGKAILLAGSHTWQNLVDSGTTNPPPVFDYTKFLDYIGTRNHNFFRLWAWEQSNWTNEIPGNWWFSPLVYQRPGPGTAVDGRPKMNLTAFNQTYFDRLRSRVIAARDRGMYVAIVLFNGWSIEPTKGSFGDDNPWKGHPYNPSNNINGIDGDSNNDNSGREVHTLAIAGVTDAQLAYIRKVIDTVNDLDNVLYEISNESHSDATSWQYYLIDYIKDYEATKPKQHPVGMTAQWPNGVNSELFTSLADWIAPNNIGDYLTNPPAADGDKVIISDTDHLCGVCGTRAWVWKSVTRGMNVTFMDPYDGKALGLGADGHDPNNPDFVSIRSNLGYARNYGASMNLAAMTPRNSLASTGYCLANAAASGGEYLVYLPSGGSVTVDLTASKDNLNVEWLNPATGVKSAGSAVAGNASRSFTAPFSGDAVLYLKGTGTGGEPTAPPGEVAGVRVAKGTATRVSWNATTGASRYDVASGTVLNLRADRSFTRASCVGNDITTTQWDDTRANPTRGDGYYYLVRAQNVAGSGSWGKNKAGAERSLPSACP